MTHCLIIQTERLKEAQRAERTLFDFLARLPAGYSLYRELKLTPAYAEQMRGSEQAKPDMVVIGPAIGVLAFEVKDWNLDMNEYEWLDQYRVRVRRRDGHQDIISNPADQAERYQRALRALLGDSDVFVQCLVAFPRLIRSEFLNRFEDLTVLSNPQSRFLLDVDRTVFRDDLSEAGMHPEDLLVRLARRHKSFRGVTPEEIERVGATLMPTTFCLGNALARQKDRRRLQVLSNEQQRWAFGIDQDKNYLLDVAGSGKTNTLISRALFLVDRASPGPAPAILLTTYNTNLEKNIRRILDSKIEAAGGDRQRYRDAITVMGMPTLCAELVRAGSSPEMSSPSPGENAAEYEARLKDWAAAALEESKGRFARFDYVLIDEIQDFDDTHLFIVTKVCKGGRFFFVGDIGQKIYERSHELKRHGIIKRDIEMEKSYRMYRTPRYIAELATSFVIKDPYVRNEFESNGYKQPVQYANTNETVAVLAEASDPFDAAAEKVHEVVSGEYADPDILLITSEHGMDRQAAALEKRGVCFSRGETEKGEKVVLVDFMNVKGLERPFVVITGIEDLSCRGPAGVFEDEEAKARDESLSRRKLYVAMTRTTEQLYMYYSGTGHRFVSELLEEDKAMARKRARRGHAI